MSELKDWMDAANAEAARVDELTLLTATQSARIAELEKEVGSLKATVEWALEELGRLDFYTPDQEDSLRTLYTRLNAVFAPPAGKGGGGGIGH